MNKLYEKLSEFITDPDFINSYLILDKGTDNNSYFIYKKGMMDGVNLMIDAIMKFNEDIDND